MLTLYLYFPIMLKGATPCGYRLTRPPAGYTVGEILTLTEGTLAVVACLQEDAPPCGRREVCRTYPMWERFDRMVQDFFYHITPEDLIKETG